MKLNEKIFFFFWKNLKISLCIELKKLHEKNKSLMDHNIKENRKSWIFGAGKDANGLFYKNVVYALAF